jgi:hypothetical protein
LASGQCFDLSSTQLVREYSRFVERWKDSDVRFDNDGWGDVIHFAPLSLGIVRKTSSGWEPLRKIRHPQHYCESTPNGGRRCYMAPYQVPPATATRRRGIGDVERWVLSAQGVLTYTRSHTVRDRDFESAEHQAQGTFDLNTGRYEVVFKDHAVGVHRHLKKEGVELWRENPFRAKATLRQAPCPATVRPAAFRADGLADAMETELTTPPPCVVKVKDWTGQGSALVPTIWEFLHNPAKASAYQGCVLAFENAAPGAPAVQVAQQKSSSSEGSGK